MQITNLKEEDRVRWDEFVHLNDRGTFFHLSKWSRVLHRSMGHKPHYLFAEDKGRVVGVLPMVLTSSLLFGRSLSSTPFCTTCGVLTDSDEVERKLVDAACRLAEDLAVGSLEIRNQVASANGWPTKNLYVNFSRELSCDHDENLKAIPRKQRAMVRKAMKNGLESEESSDLDRFYRVYSTSVKNLGTPVFSKKLFQSLLEEFENKCRILMITKDGRDVAAVMSYYHKDKVIPYFGGSLSEARRLQANDFMYWELMRRSVDEGVRVFDYGRSKVGTGSYSFKKNWGFEPKPLYYEYFLVKDTTIPEVNPTNKKYAKAIDVWKKLPLPVANIIGPLVSKTLG